MTDDRPPKPRTKGEWFWSTASRKWMKLNRHGLWLAFEPCEGSKPLPKPKKLEWKVRPSIEEFFSFSGGQTVEPMEDTKRT